MQYDSYVRTVTYEKNNNKYECKLSVLFEGEDTPELVIPQVTQALEECEQEFIQSEGGKKDKN